MNIKYIPQQLYFKQQIVNCGLAAWSMKPAASLYPIACCERYCNSAFGDDVSAFLSMEPGFFLK
jgi:hypothetical protein